MEIWGFGDSGDGRELDFDDRFGHEEKQELEYWILEKDSYLYSHIAGIRLTRRNLFELYNDDSYIIC